MKKIVVLILAVCVLFLLTACFNEKETTGILPYIPDDPIPVMQKYETFIYQQMGIPVIERHYDREKASAFEEYEYIDESAPLVLQKEFFGEKYTLVYFKSIRGDADGRLIHQYKNKDFDDHPVWFDAISGELVRISIPYSQTLTTEKEYTDFIATLVDPEHFDLSEMRYECETGIAYSTENWYSKNSESRFVSEAGENEEIIDYHFYYKEYIDDVLRTGKRIRATFLLKEQRLILDTRDVETDSALASTVIDSLDMIENSIDLFLGDVTDNYLLLNQRIYNHELFVRNGIPYLLSFVTFTVWDCEYEGEFDTTVIMITCLE